MRSSFAAVISFVAVVVAMLLSYFVIGWGIVVPILENFIEVRRQSGESVGAFEAIVVFVLVMSYMLVTTAMVTVSTLFGWMVRRMWNERTLSWRGVMSMFRVEQPD